MQHDLCRHKKKARHCIHPHLHLKTMVDFQLRKNKIKVTSWNVKGIKNPMKRTRILSHLAHLKTDIAMLQEIHLLNEESLKLKQKWVGQVLSLCFNSRSRGVVISNKGLKR